MKFYAVKHGFQTGIFTEWNMVKKLVTNFPNAKHKSFKDEKEAKEYLNELKDKEENTIEIYCDGGHNKQTGKEGWGSVVDFKGNCLLSQHRNLIIDLPIHQSVKLKKDIRDVLISNFTDVKTQQTNGAELLALLAALRIAIHLNKKVIGCDSNVVLSWTDIKNREVKRDGMDVRKKQYLNEANLLREKFEKEKGKIIKIKGDNNLADLGFHK